MTLLNEGLDELATQFASLISKGQWGTGTTLPTPSDTGLETPVAATLLSVTASSSGNSAQFTHEVNSVLGNSNDLTEFELQFASGDSLNHTLGGPISKTSSVEVTTITTVNFIRG